jgi:hypothetical protein
MSSRLETMPTRTGNSSSFKSMKPQSIPSVHFRNIVAPGALLSCLFALTGLYGGSPVAALPSVGAQTPGFTKPVAHDAAFFPTTKAYNRAGDLMRATVIRGNKNVAMETNDVKWVTRIGWLNAVTTPGVNKALTFSAVDDVRRLLQFVPADVDVIEYNLEGAMTPDSDYTNMPQSVATFSQIVRASGRTFGFGPIRNTWTALEKKGQFDAVLKNCDSVAVQMQRFFQSAGSTSDLVAEVSPLVKKFRAANPNVKVNLQLWLGRQTVPQMIEGFRAMEPDLDVAVIGTHSNQNGVLQVLKALRVEYRVH